MGEAALTPGSLVLVRGRSYPDPGQLCLIGLLSGKVVLREFWPEGKKVFFREASDHRGRELVVTRRGAARQIRWVHPVPGMTAAPYNPFFHPVRRSGMPQKNRPLRGR